MNTKMSLNIGGRNFDVDVDENFAPFIKAKIKKDFNSDKNNDLKVLLQAYVRRTHELYMNESKIDAIIKKIDK